MATRQDRQKYWKKHYNSFQDSGLSQRDYCRKNNLGYWSFNQWKRRFDKTNPDTSLQKIPVKSFRKTSPEERLEILLQDKIKISVPDNFSPETLKTILSILGNE